MTTLATHNPQDTTTEGTLFVAFELSEKTWKLGFTTGHGQKPRERSVSARQQERVLDEIAQAKRRRKRNKKVSVHLCLEHLCAQDARRGEVALGATGGHQEVQAEQGVARCGGTMDMHEQRRREWALCTPLLFLPP